MAESPLLRTPRLAVDAEYGYLELTQRGPSNTRYGVAHDAGVNARFEVLRFGSRTVGPNSMVGVYVEAGIGRQLRSSDARDPAEPPRRILPAGGTNHLSAGVGFIFDHRLEQPRGFPTRVGWQLGWRVIGSPRPAPDTIVSQPSYPISCRTRSTPGQSTWPLPGMPRSFSQV